MIWQALGRGASVIFFTQGVMSLVDRLFAEEILPHRVYKSSEAARFLGVDRHKVLELIRGNQLKGTLSEGNYRILGSSILEYLNK